MSDEYWNDPWGLNERWAKANAWYKAHNPSPPAAVQAGLLSVPESPTWSESMGRGFMDVLEPVKQGWLNATDTASANAYRKQRTADERIYTTGLLQRAPKTDERAPVDLWRMQGQLAALTPLMLPGIGGAPGGLLSREAMLGEMGTWNLVESLNALRRRFGIME